MVFVAASLSFLKNDPRYQLEKPYQIISGFASSEWQTNCMFESIPNIPITNCRDETSQFSLQANGFEFCEWPCKHLLNQGILENEERNARDNAIELYLKSTISQIREKLDAVNVVCFDWRLRSRNATKLKTMESEKTDIRHRLLDVAQVVHQDNSLDGGRAMLNKILQQQELVKYFREGFRVQILKSGPLLHICFKLVLKVGDSNYISVWRPITNVVYDFPLAFCDPRTMTAQQLHKVDKVHENHVDEGVYLTYSEAQKWYYLHEQTEDEVSIFRTWDSDTAGRLLIPPHAAFIAQRGTDKASRMSIEVRMIVITRE